VITPADYHFRHLGKGLRRPLGNVHFSYDKFPKRYLEAKYHNCPVVSIFLRLALPSYVVIKSLEQPGC
jgi:hypothetical protein